MRYAAALLALLACCLAVPARPEYNACSMKNAAGKPASTTATPSAGPADAAAEGVRRGRVDPHKPRARRSAIGWEQGLRDILVRPRAEEDSTPGQWWEDAPSDMDWARPVRDHGAWALLAERAEEVPRPTRNRGGGGTGAENGGAGDGRGAWGDIKGPQSLKV